MNESAMILNAFENRVTAGFVKHTMQTNSTVEQNKTCSAAKTDQQLSPEMVIKIHEIRLKR